LLAEQCQAWVFSWAFVVPFLRQHWLVKVPLLLLYLVPVGEKLTYPFARRLIYVCTTALCFKSSDEGSVAKI
jgi:hypothetical protein